MTKKKKNDPRKNGKSELSIIILEIGIIKHLLRIRRRGKQKLLLIFPER